VAYEISKTEQQWRTELSAEAYEVLRGKGTERAFTGKFVDTKDAGTYRCGACGNELFDAATKFESHSGWPSFFEAVRPGHPHDPSALGRQEWCFLGVAGRHLDRVEIAVRSNREVIDGGQAGPVVGDGAVRGHVDDLR